MIAFSLIVTIIGSVCADLSNANSINDLKKISESQKKKVNSLKEVLETYAGANDPVVETAINALKVLQTESSTHISERKDQVGFLSLNALTDQVFGAVRSHNIDKLIALWLEDDSFLSLTSEYKSMLSSTLAEYALQILEEKYSRQKYKLSFNDGKGKLFMMIVSFEPHPKVSNAVKYAKFLSYTTFEPAPSYVIVSSTDCNILSCDHDEQIVYLPVTVTDVHMHSIINWNIAMLTAFSQHVTPNSALTDGS